MEDPRTYAECERVLKVLCGKSKEDIFKQYEHFCKEHFVIDFIESTGNFLFVFYLVPKEDIKKLRED